MFAWLSRRRHELPDDERPTRVDFVGHVVAPNVVRSPITSLGAARYGDRLVVADAQGRTLLLEKTGTCRVIPFSPTPILLDVAPPPELVFALKKSRHTVAYREARFREGDRVRVVGTVQAGLVTVQGGYRSANARAFVPVETERLDLHELL